MTAGPTTTAAPTPGSLALPDGTTVFVEFPRYLQLQQRLEAAFDNQSGTELWVTEVALRSPLFEPVAADEGRTRVEVGRRRDLQMGMGAAVCPAPVGPSRVEVTAEIDGVVRHGVVDVDPAPLQRISAAACGRELVLAHVTPNYSPSFTLDGDVLETSIELERVEGNERISVGTVRGSVLLELRAAAAASPPLGVLEPGATTTAFPVQLRVIRCDPHAVIESKKTFQLSIWVAIGAREPQHIVLAPTGELRGALEGLIEDCLVAEHGG